MKTILVPTDFSEPAFNAALYALELANEFDASVHLLNVYHIPNPLQTLPLEIIITPDELKRDTDSALKKTAKSLKEIKPYDIKIELASRNGLTEKEIDGYARFISADLIVMGMRGAGKIREKLIGSTTTSLIRHSSFPVLVVPGKAMFRPYEEITFATDGNEIHEQSHLGLMLMFAKKFNAEIHVLNILSPRDLADKDLVVETMERSFMNTRHDYYFPETDEVSRGIDKFIHEHPSQLLVMVPRKHGFFTKLFSEEHTTRLAFHSEVPILALHD